MPYPLKEFDKANLIGVFLNTHGKFLEYFEETYKVWFLEGLEAGSEENLRKCFAELSLSFEEIVAGAYERKVQK